MSNPFRKKLPGTIDTSRTGSPKSSMRAEDTQPGDKKNKPVKKVRVLSPPPLSPDSPEWSFDAAQPPAPLSYENYNYASYYPSFDPFNGASTDESDRDSTATPPPPPPNQREQQYKKQDGMNSGTPANPFSKTLQDIEGSKELQKEREEEGEVLKAANEGRKSLNVDSFKRLLMTGNAGDDASSVSTDRGDEAEKMKTSGSAAEISTGRRTEYPGSSADSSDSHEEEEGSKTYSASQLSKEKKAPPPPPSSRHGKSLKQQGVNDVKADKDDGYGPSTPARRSMDDEELPLDVDATKVSVGEADAEPQLNSTQSMPSTKKSAPAPPPPRGHAKSDSRSNDIEAPVRTSSDGMPSRSDSTRSTGLAPAPPPPRRPFAAPKQTSSTSSPSVSSSNVPPSTDQAEDNTTQSQHDTPTPSKSSVAPPPPPARQLSTRRPASVTGVDAPSRRISSENKSREGVPPPPPPRPRHRGSSPGDGRKVSGEAYRPSDPGKSADILADLDALQREVDALRGQMK
ncbi:hypothetical protein VFPPC_14297 [Pochonia chlamydosporia 170]|uniref:Uncharacterized protein n=1 Tax=Pochonia chlamydosporia 170 TaxID=1380566 RepID=A0A179FKK8_METCM|nr:hypothetical protein VFPPC_14297 [Pochonia chlamydosporia 170]OAQ66166.1 hypothetical protein VFPPC_14297 [Pochonia chlamydosporia 170]